MIKCWGETTRETDVPSLRPCLLRDVGNGPTGAVVHADVDDVSVATPTAIDGCGGEMGGSAEDSVEVWEMPKRAALDSAKPIDAPATVALQSADAAEEATPGSVRRALFRERDGEVVVPRTSSKPVCPRSLN